MKRSIRFYFAFYMAKLSIVALKTIRRDASQFPGKMAITLCPNFLDQIGWGFDKMEAMGIASPVLEVNCKYKHSTVFNQKVSIQVSVKEFKGLKLYIDYVICDAESQKVCATGTSCHCFLNSEGKPIFMEKEYPDFFTIMNFFVKMFHPSPEKYS